VRVVWKYVIDLAAVKAGEVSFDMPVGAELLTVQTQAAYAALGHGALWALVDPTAPKETRRFRVVPTGGSPEELTAERYVGTFQLGRTVWHVFEHLEDLR
jgi:hypothetical protein